MSSEKNITRFNYTETSFSGWRLAMRRKGIPLLVYFPDKRYGSEQAALAAAVDMRDRILDALKSEPAVQVFDRFRKESPSAGYPRGLHPRRCVG